jgi:pimeloyl-ACP methyl ester carboxylesterase
MPIAGSRSRLRRDERHRLSVHRAGAGAPLILLHGYPQNHMSWEKVAPGFARHFDVIVPDLRGYGDSDAPPDDTEHTVYSKREMARDIVGMMDALGIGRAHVLGHDRGARVSYRLALDHPDRVDRLGIVEAVPTGDFWAAWTAELAFKAYHWTFLAQPAPLPERMILADGPGYIDWTLASWAMSRDLSPFSRRRWTATGNRPATRLASPRCAAITGPGPGSTACLTRQTGPPAAGSRRRCISSGRRTAFPPAAAIRSPPGGPGRGRHRRRDPEDRPFRHG